MHSVTNIWAQTFLVDHNTETHYLLGIVTVTFFDMTDYRNKQ